MSGQLLRRGYIPRGGQIIDATLVPAPKQHIDRDEKALIEQPATPAEWTPTKRRQKDRDAVWTKKHAKSHFGYKLSINVDKRYKLIRKLETATASVQIAGTSRPCSTQEIRAEIRVYLRVLAGAEAVRSPVG